MIPILLMRIRQLFIFLLASAFVIGLILLIKNSTFRFREAKSESTAPIVERHPISSSDVAGFDALLSMASSEQLPKMLANLADDRDLEPVERLDRMGKRVEVMDRILAVNPDTKARNFAVLSKLKTLMNREFVLVENDLVIQGHSAQLKEFANQYRQSDNISIASSATVAAAVAAISEFMRAESPDNRTELAKTAIEQMQLAAVHSGNDVSNANRLYNWLQLIRAKCERSESQLFFNNFAASYEKSDNFEVAALAGQVRAVFEESEIELVNIIDSLPKDRNEAIGQLRVQVDAALNRSDVFDSTTFYVLSRANELLAFGRTDDALAIRQQLANWAKKDSTGTLEAELAKFDQRLKLFARPFDVSSFTDFDSKPVKFKNANAKYRILYFVAAIGHSESILAFNELLPVVTGELLNSRLELVVVYIDRQDSLEKLNDLKTFAGKSVHWQVWYLDATTDRGKEFSNRVPIDETPYIVILDKNDHVLSLNPPIVGIEEILFAE